MAGPPPKPTHLKLIEGNRGKQKLNKREPIAPGALHAPPSDLTPSQKLAWTYAIANAPLNLLRRIDRTALKAFVIAEDLHAKANREIAKPPSKGGGLMIKTANGNLIQSPYLAILNRQAQIMLKAAAEMGFTPSSRSRIEVPGGDPDPEKPGEEEELF